MENFQRPPIYKLEEIGGNSIYIMRDDLLPYSFGGNKVRKAVLFFREIDAGGYQAVVTYGSGGSNHCRIIANMAAERGLPCYVISTEAEEGSMNRRMVRRFGAEVTVCPVEKVASVIEETLERIRKSGLEPFFIPGGGHGNTGTKAYDLAYDEIRAFEKERKLSFDSIFFASGTGTTQAGLVCGMERCGDRKRIVGISIARKAERGRQVVIDSIRDYQGSCREENVIFDDSYICGGYGKYDEFIDRTIGRMLQEHGIPLDPTYTGKAYAGMERYIAGHGLHGQNILFIHTGGAPIYFDWLESKA